MIARDIAHAPALAMPDHQLVQGRILDPAAHTGRLVTEQRREDRGKLPARSMGNEAEDTLPALVGSPQVLLPRHLEITAEETPAATGSPPRIIREGERQALEDPLSESPVSPFLPLRAIDLGQVFHHDIRLFLAQAVDEPAQPAVQTKLPLPGDERRHHEQETGQHIKHRVADGADDVSFTPRGHDTRT